MAVTIKEVAALAGVSPSTVSRTCKDNPSISPETKERVRRAMDQLGYEYSMPQAASSAQTLRNIGVILPPSSRETYENPFYLETIRGISQFCNTHQCMSMVITGANEREILNTVQLSVTSGRLDGFILLYSRENDPIVETLYNEGILYVLVGKAYQYTNQTVYIDNDNQLAGQEAAEYLWKLGHRKIAYVGKEQKDLYSADRKAGYQLALLKHGLPVDPSYIIEESYAPEKDTGSLEALLSRSDRPTGIVVSDDILAVVLERVCLKLGLTIPGDLSIVSFNNSLFARLTSPPLTSIDVNSFQLGIEAASQLINHIENPNLLATKIIVPHIMMERSSCRAVKADEA